MLRWLCGLSHQSLLSLQTFTLLRILPTRPSLFFAIPHNNNYHGRVLLAMGLAFYMY